MFVKGKSGNPSGRPRSIFKIADAAQAHAQAALDVLVLGMADEDGRVRIAAAKEILDRGFGKSVAMTADVTDRLGEMDDDALDAAINAAREAIRSGGKAGAGKGAPTEH